VKTSNLTWFLFVFIKFCLDKEFFTTFAVINVNKFMMLNNTGGVYRINYVSLIF
jgi:hypothetical protein